MIPLPEPVQRMGEVEDQEEDNILPFVSVSVELHEETDGNSNSNNEDLNCEAIIAEPDVTLHEDDTLESVPHVTLHEDDTLESVPHVTLHEDDTLESVPHVTLQEMEMVESTPDLRSEEMESVESTPDISLDMHNYGDEEIGNVPDSTGQDINEDSVASFDSTVIKPEPLEPDYDQIQKTYINDFIYSNASSFDEGSNSNFDDTKEEPKGSPLARFPTIVKAVETADYETLQVLFHLLYQRSAWDTQEVLIHGLLEFSGFPFNQNSDEYTNRMYLLQSQPHDMLAKIGTILGLENQKMLNDPVKHRQELISTIMNFLSKPCKKTKCIRIVVEDAPPPIPKRPTTKCGCRNACVLKFTKAEQHRLLEYSKELDEKKLLESYLLNFIDCKKIIRAPESFGNFNYKKLKGVTYTYRCKYGKKEVFVCKGGFCVLHGVKLGRIGVLLNKVKTGTNLPKKIKLEDFPPLLSEADIKKQEEMEAKRAKRSPRKKQQPTESTSSNTQIKKVWVSSEDQIRMMEDELKDSIKNSDSPKKSPKLNSDTKSSKLKEFPLVVKAVENAAEELLVDVHFLLFHTAADTDKIRSNILDFDGFDFDSDTEEYDERNGFLQRMTFKIVCDVCRIFSIGVLNTKEESIKNLMQFLSKPDESFLRETVSMPLSLSDVELDDFEMSDSDESITCEVVEKKVECIILFSSGEDSDGEPKSKSKKLLVPKIEPNTTTPQISSCSSVSQSNNDTGGTRCLRDFETIKKIVNTHPHEYLVDIFELLYLRKYEPSTLRDDILNFTGFTFEVKSPEYIKRKQLLDRMLYNSVRRIYNTLIHTSSEVKVFSKPTMIGEIFQFLMNIPDHDTSVRPPPVSKPITKIVSSFPPSKIVSVNSVAPAGNKASGKLSDLKRVFQRVACFPCEYLVDVHKLLFMTDADSKTIRQNIFAFDGFDFDVSSQEFQQRKMYLEYLTFHSLRKISSVLTTRSVDLRNSTKHELATHLTQVLAEYTKLKDGDAPPSETPNETEVTSTSVVSATPTASDVENIVIYPSLSFPSPVVNSVTTSATSSQSSTSNVPVTETAPAPLNISIVDTRSVSSPTKSAKSKRKRKSTPVKQVTKQKPIAPAPAPQSDVYGQNLNSFPSQNSELIISGESVVGETPTKKTKINSSTSDKIAQEETGFHNKLRDTVNTEDDEDCDKPLASLVGHPIDSVLRKQIVDIVESNDLESITINGVIQKIFSMYPKFDLAYRKEFIKSTLRSILYRLGEEKSSLSTDGRNTNSPDCSVTTTGNSENVSESAMEC
ncbi:DEK_C domain-containing protein [Caerostris darwini]|uniref:DEK_C domain-containing protein n=1 Tax=Caerostris darwini TaxID=1538125 RepID=A0AAV4U6Z2_9ARAC|nr:DEK_C domain-containing protein [Caerostris darwini]